MLDLGVVLVNHNDFISLFLPFKSCNFLAYVNVVWGNVWIAIIGEILGHKNKHIFKGGVVDHSNFFFFGLTKGLVLDYNYYCLYLFFFF